MPASERGKNHRSFRSFFFPAAYGRSEPVNRQSQGVNAMQDLLKQFMALTDDEKLAFMKEAMPHMAEIFQNDPQKMMTEMMPVCMNMMKSKGMDMNKMRTMMKNMMEQSRKSRFIRISRSVGQKRFGADGGIDEPCGSEAIAPRRWRFRWFGRLPCPPSSRGFSLAPRADGARTSKTNCQTAIYT